MGHVTKINVQKTYNPNLTIDEGGIFLGLKELKKTLGARDFLEAVAWNTTFISNQIKIILRNI
jgi:hypothetical protein